MGREWTRIKDSAQCIILQPPNSRYGCLSSGPAPLASFDHQGRAKPASDRLSHDGRRRLYSLRLIIESPLIGGKIHRRTRIVPHVGPIAPPSQAGVSGALNRRRFGLLDYRCGDAPSQVQSGQVIARKLQIITLIFDGRRSEPSTYCVCPEACGSRSRPMPPVSCV
jgi:hypothetical protein